MKLSIVIPAYNEEESIAETIDQIAEAFSKVAINYEIFVVNDNSKDNTLQVLETLAIKYTTLKYATNLGPNGFGYAIRYGLDQCTGDCIAIMMADLSDDPNDLIRYYNTMIEGNYDCVFGSRFIKGGKVIDYPFVKKIINRIANLIIRSYGHQIYTEKVNKIALSCNDDKVFICDDNIHTRNHGHYLNFKKY